MGGSRSDEGTAPIHPLIAGRWSSRAFDPDRELTDAELAAVLEAARWAPSSGNSQPWRFLVWRRGRDPQAFAAALATLEPGNREWVVRARALVAVCADLLDKRDRPNRFAAHDAGMATQNLLLQAHALGLVAHPMAGYDADALVALAAIPARFAPQAVIALGHPGDPALLHERHLKKEDAPRERRALAETVFEGVWGDPAR